MPDILVTVLSFLVAIGVLVAVHEYGHFQVARWCGVKVLRFSIGFGKPIWSCRGKDGVEYVIAAVPLGGYVKMLDRRETEVDEADLPREFMAQPIWKRNAIVVAGPAANFIFAIFAYWVAFVLGIPGQTPVIGTVVENTPAIQADLRSGDRLVSIGSDRVPTWEAASLSLIRHTIDEETATIQLLRNDQEITTQLNLKGIRVDPQTLFKEIGISGWTPTVPPEIIGIRPALPGADAGLQAGDLILKADDVDVLGPGHWLNIVHASLDVPIRLEIERDGATISTMITPQQHPETSRPVGYVGTEIGWSDLARRSYAENETSEKYGVVESLGVGVERTWQMSVLTVRMFWKMITREASLKNVSGPLSIGQFAGLAASEGLTKFLSLLAIVSIGLGVINLLPIPVLDGGHLLYYCAEFIKGSPVSEQTQRFGQTVGLTAIIALMGLAFYNDFTRLFG